MRVRELEYRAIQAAKQKHNGAAKATEGGHRLSLVAGSSISIPPGLVEHEQRIEPDHAIPPKIDLEQADRFLRLLDPAATGFTYQTFWDSKVEPEKPELARAFHASNLDQLLYLHSQGAGAYVTVNRTDGAGRKICNIVGVRAVWQEDDDGGSHEFPIEPSIEVETSPGHCHRYWFVADDWPVDEQGCKDFADVMERMVETYGSDKNAKDISRVLRIPGFLHRKGERHYTVKIIGGNERRYTRDEVKAAFPPVEPDPEPRRQANGAHSHQDNGANHSTSDKRGKAWAEGALRNIADRLAGLDGTGRNSACFSAAAKLGNMVARAWLGREAVRGRLLDAMHSNGYVKTDGLRKAEDTIERGLETGMKTPHPDLRDNEKSRRYNFNDDGEIHEEEPTNPADSEGDGENGLPFGYDLSAKGLTFKDPSDLDAKEILIAGRLDIIAETRDGDGQSWGVLLRWKDHDGKDHQLALPRATLAGDGSEARRILMDGGFYISPSNKARGLFNAFLLRVRSPKRARATERIGWHGDAFVLPDECFGAGTADVPILQTAKAYDHKFRQAGTLESWKQNVAGYAVGNSRLVFAMSMAFSGPLLGPCSAESGGANLKGDSSIGKTTALFMAGSAWGGNPNDVNGFNETWRATANGLEGVAAGHSDTLLCLDELKMIDAKEAGTVAYMLANGKGKSRATRDLSMRKSASWRGPFLSCGEIGLADKISEDGKGKRLAAGQQVRIVDIPADMQAGYGIFENIHGFESAERLATYLRSATQQNHGVAAREYLKAIVPKIEAVRKIVPPLMKAFCDKHVPSGAGGQVQRVAQRFALISIAGELARQNGILPWPEGEATDAAVKCFKAWLAARGGHDAAEISDGIEQVRSFLNANGMARFLPAWEEGYDGKFPPRDVCGYRKKVGDGWDFYVTGSAWREEVCKGMDARRLAAALKQRGYIDDSGGGGDGRHISKEVRVPGHGKKRLYHVLSALLEGDENA